MTVRLMSGIVHRVNPEMRKALSASPQLIHLWNGLTPRARNEWICYVTSAKKKATQHDHIRRMSEDILCGKRRPCCWPGCPHRTKGD